MKKIFILGLFASLLFVQNVQAENIQNSKEIKNSEVFVKVPDSIRNKHKKNRNIVRFYFSYSCNFCKSVHSFVSVWGNSLPKGYTYIETPVVDQSDSSRMLAAAHKYVTENAKNQYHIDRFNNNIYKNIHKITNTNQLSRLIKEVIVDAQVDPGNFLKQFKNKKFTSQLEDDFMLQRDYNISVTPSVVIGNEYLTHLGLVEGDQSKFIELLNGVTNMHMYSNVGIK